MKPLSLLLLLLAAPVWANDWPNAEKAMESVVYLEHKGGSCSGIVIDESRNYVLTAAHCDPNEKDAQMYVNQTPARIVWKDAKSDLMVVRIEDLRRPALKLSEKDPQIGDEIASIGYGYGYDRPMFRVTHVSDNEARIPELSGRYVMVDTPFVSGQSGGAVINHKGELVAIVQASNQLLAVGRGAEEIKKRVGRYFTVEK